MMEHGWSGGWRAPRKKKQTNHSEILIAENDAGGWRGAIFTLKGERCNDSYNAGPPFYI
jgi:hypothetical protein